MENVGIGGVVLEDAPCPNGCPNNDEFIVEAKDLLSGMPGYFRVVRCRSCNLMRTNPRPTAETISHYYPENYGPYAGTRIAKNVDFGIAGKWKKIIKNVFSAKSTLLPTIYPGKMLEVGCASGSFLHQMEKVGWDVEGIEFSEEAASDARSHGYKVTSGSLESVREHDKEYDLIVAWMVIEHLHQPVYCLERLNSWIKNNGYLVISVPNASKFYMTKYSYNLQLPTHLYHFTPYTIAALLEKTGWKIEKIVHQITLSSLLASIGYWIRETRGKGKIGDWLIGFPETGQKLQYIFFPLAYLLAKFGQTGRMTIWAKKIND